MIEKNLTIKSPNGLHARPAGVFAKKAAEFKSEITIKATKGSANAKSIMSLMALGLDQGADVVLAASGEDADLAISELTKLLEV